MTNEDDSTDKPYDLDERTYQFSLRVRKFVRTLPRTISNIEGVKQVARASGSIGVNYIEANESLGKKDFLMHIKVCRKESKESRYWLGLLDTHEDAVISKEREWLVGESTELLKIFSASSGNPNDVSGTSAFGS